MTALRPWIEDRLNQFRETNSQPVTRREYHLLVAMIGFAVLIGVIALFR